MKKNRTKKIKMRNTKRKSIFRIAIPGICVSVALAAVTGALYRVWQCDYLETQFSDHLDFAQRSHQEYVTRVNDCGEIVTPEELGGRLSILSGAYLSGDRFLFENYADVSPLTPGFHWAVAVVDEETHEVIADNSWKFIMRLNEKAEVGGRYYTFPEYTGIPAAELFWAEYQEWRTAPDVSVILELDSVYLNHETMQFIPHTGTLRAFSAVLPSKENGYQSDNEELLNEAVSIYVDTDAHPEYVLTEVSHEESVEGIPRYNVLGMYGKEKWSVDYLIQNELSEYDDVIHVWQNSVKIDDKTVYKSSWSPSFRMNAGKYELMMVYTIDKNLPCFWVCTLAYAGMVLLGALIVTFLLSWRKYTLNKAHIAFEEYQRALINNLAHDMKTPLTAIGGYAENAKKSMEKNEPAPVSEYLDAITKNVFYIDGIVNRTLELNHIQQLTAPKKEAVKLEELVQAALDKYLLMLEEKQITVQTEGSGTMQADKGSLTPAVENLISNAVKYTPEGGSISVRMAEHSLTICNDTAEDVDIRALEQAFVKGDKARSKKDGSGLGLPIVRSAADVNGIKFRMESKDQKCTATLTQ